MKKIKRTHYDAKAPIVKPCTIDVHSIWQRKEKHPLIAQLEARVSKILFSEKQL